MADFEFVFTHISSFLCRYNDDKLKGKLGILSSIRDHRKKVGKQRSSPTPADILVNI